MATSFQSALARREPYPVISGLPPADVHLAIAPTIRTSDVPRPLSFGTGPHFCLGANLARMAIEETIRGFAEKDVRLMGDPDEVAWRLVLGRGPASLPVKVATAA